MRLGPGIRGWDTVRMRARPLLRPIRLIGSRASRLSISKQVLLLQLAVALLLTAGGTAAAIQQARSTDFDHARAETLALAETIADERARGQ